MSRLATTSIVSMPSKHAAMLASAPMVFAIVAAAFLLTLSPDLTWRFSSSDGPELITASYTLGVAHPPGYPTYILAGKAFSFIPIGSIAGRYALLSMIGGALAAAWTAAAAYRMLASANLDESRLTIASAGAGLTVAFVPVFWQQAVVAEVYALNAALVAAFTLTLFGAATRKRIWLRGLLVGLACTTHLSSLLLFPVALLNTRRSQWTTLLTAVLLGLSPYLLLPALALSGGTVWGDFGTIEGFAAIVSAAVYQSNVLGVGAAEVWRRLADWWFPASIMLAAMLTSAGTWRKQRPAGRASTGFQLSLTGAMLAYWVVALTYDSHDAVVLLVGSLPLTLVLLAPALGRYVALAVALPILALVLSIMQLNETADPDIRARATADLARIEPNALVLVSDEQSLFALWYFRHVEQVRTDLTFVSPDLFQFDWYRRSLAKAEPHLIGLESDDLDQFLTGNANQRVICRLSLLWPNGLRCPTALGSP